jgi:hypothetical protein
MDPLPKAQDKRRNSALRRGEVVGEVERLSIRTFKEVSQ